MKMACIFRVSLETLLFLLLLLIVVLDFESDEVVNNDRETKTLVLFLPWDDDVEEDE